MLVVVPRQRDDIHLVSSRHGQPVFDWWIMVPSFSFADAFPRTRSPAVTTAFAPLTDAVSYVESGLTAVGTAQ